MAKAKNIKTSTTIEPEIIFPAMKIDAPTSRNLDELNISNIIGKSSILNNQIINIDNEHNQLEMILDGRYVKITKPDVSECVYFYIKYDENKLFSGIEYTTNKAEVSKIPFVTYNPSTTIDEPFILIDEINVIKTIFQKFLELKSLTALETFALAKSISFIAIVGSDFKSGTIVLANSFK